MNDFGSGPVPDTRPPIDADVAALVEETGVPSDLVMLAASVSLPPMVPYDALRAVRMELFPYLESNAEAALATSPLTRARTTVGLMLEPRFRRAALALLRGWFHADAATATRVLSRLRALTTGTEDDTSPLLVTETLLAWDYVSTTSAELEEAVEARLHDVAVTAVAESRHGIIEWGAAAQGRLPAPCWRGTSAWILAQLAAAERIEVGPVPVPSQLDASDLLKLAAELLPVVVVGVRRGPGVLELGPPSRQRNLGLAVIGTDPFVIRFSDHDHHGRRLAPRQIELERGETLEVPCGDNAITLLNLAGQSFTLAPLKKGVSPESTRAMQAFDAALSLRARGLPAPARVVRRVEHGYVVALQDVPVTAYMLSPHRLYHPGDELSVVIDKVAHDRRWIRVRPARGATVQPRPGESVLSIPEDHMPRRVQVGSQYPAKVIKHGAERPGGRSAHVYIDSRTALGRIIFKHRRGFLRFPNAVQLVDDLWTPPVGAEMVVAAAGISGGRWELRLSIAEEPGGPLTPHVRRGVTVRAEVTSIEPDGSWLETRDRAVLWLPREAMWPSGVTPHRHLHVGQSVEVTVVLNEDERGYVCSEKAIREPFLEQLTAGTQLTGTVINVDGERLTLAVDPITSRSIPAFTAAGTARAGEDLAPGQPVIGVVSELRRRQWELVLTDVARLGAY